MLVGGTGEQLQHGSVLVVEGGHVVDKKAMERGEIDGLKQTQAS